ncbi:MAG: hypothetical protein HZA24_00225 [Nitrospirae bacterium]|nr:hypothetical protein [Nitrospirota bacterium]
MRIRATFSALAALAAVLLATGCATMDKAYVGTVKAVDPDQLRLKQESRWLNPHPNFRLVGEDKMKVYVRVRDSSGSDLDISREVRMALEDQGYTLTRNLDDAQYVLSADIRYYGENSHVDGGRATMTAGVGGAVIGGIIGKQSNRTTGGAMVGGLVTGLLFDTLAQRNKVREFDVVVDTRIGERVPGGVHTIRRSEDDSSLSHSGRAAAGGGDSGWAAGELEESQRASFEEDFLYSQNRLVVFVQKLNLQPEEAAPVLQERMIRALSNVLP